MGKSLLVGILLIMLLVAGCGQPAAKVEDLDKLRSQLADSQAELAEKSKRIQELEAKIAGLEATIAESETRIAGLEANLTKPPLIHNGLFYDPDHINTVRNNLHVEPWASAYRELRSKAEESMEVEPEPIRGHWHVPKPNEDRPGYDAAIKPLRDSTKAMLACSQLYFFSGEEKYAKKAVEIANAWTGSLMDIDGGIVRDAKAGAIEESWAKWEAQRGILVMAIAFEMLRDYEGWSSNEKNAFGHWLNERTSYLMVRRYFANYQEYWLAAQAAAVGVATEDRALFEWAVSVYKKAIAYDISPGGHMPMETARGSGGMRYQNFAIRPLVLVAEIARRQGLDLWGYTFEGKNLRLAIDYLLHFIDNPAEWPWSQEPQDLGFTGYMGWLEMAYYHYRDNKLIKYVEERRPVYDRLCGGMTTLTHGLPVE